MVRNTHGEHYEPIRHRKTSGREVLELAATLRQVYSDYSIAVPLSSELESIIVAAETFGMAVESGTDLTSWGTQRYLSTVQSVLNLQITATAVKWAQNKPGLELHLRKLLKGSVDPTSRHRAVAKDFLFEIQILSLFESAGMSAEFREPDVVLSVDGQEIAVACKNLYLPDNPQNFERTLENQLRKGKSQIAKSGLHGVIALAIQNVISHRDLFSCPTEEEFGQRVSLLSDRFVRQHEALFASAINSRKVFGVILLLTTLTRLDDIQTFASAQYATINNRCSETSPYFAMLRRFERQLANRQL